MEMKKINANNNEYTFINESVITRNGFAHKTTLLKNGNEIAKNKCNYYNRTWESYRFRNVMSGCVYDLIENRIAFLKRKFMTEKGYKKLTEKRKSEFENFINSDNIIKEYRELKEAL